MPERSTYKAEHITIIQEESGDLWIRHNNLHTHVRYDEPRNEFWRDGGRWTIISSEEFPETVGQLYTGPCGSIIRITDLILNPPKEVS